MRHNSASTFVLSVVFGAVVGRTADAQDELASIIARETACQETVLDRKESPVAEDLAHAVPYVPRWCSMLELKRQHVHIGDCELYCEIEGEGPPIVLLHGGPGATHHYFHPAFARGAKFAKIIYYDQRGCGVSEWNGGVRGYSFDQAVEDLDKLRQRLNFDRWIVLGHSYGGLLAQFYAITYPERVAGLVLVDSSMGFGADTGPSRQYQFMTEAEQARVREAHGDREALLSLRVYNAFVNGDWKRQNFCKPTPAQFSRIALYEWKHDAEFRDRVGGQISWLDLRGAFDGCPIPTLIIEGKWDLTWGEHKPEVFHANHPDARLVVVDNAGHAPFASNPDAFFPVLREFVQTLPDRPPARLDDWKKHVATWRDRPRQVSKELLTSLGWGYRSSLKIADAYEPSWLTELSDTSLIMRAAFALYDAEQYEPALALFRKLSEATSQEPLYQATALVWQGHMLDLLGRRKEALPAYQKAVDLKVPDKMQHGQYRMTYNPSKYAAERLKTPFARVENRMERD